MLPFHLAAQRFAIPLDHVIRVMPMLLPTPLPRAPADIAGIVSVHGQVLPVVDLARTFNLPELHITLWTPMIWLRTLQREILVPVSSIEEITLVEPETFIDGSHPTINSPLLNGVLCKAEQLLLILNIEALLNTKDEAALQQALAAYLKHSNSHKEGRS